MCHISAQTIRRIMNKQFNSPVDGGMEIIEDCSLKESLQNYEREIILQAMLKYKSTYKAAKALKTFQSTIVRRIRQLGIKLEP